MAKSLEEKREYQREYYLKNREEILKRRRVWAKANKDKTEQYQIKHYAKKIAKMKKQQGSVK